jgi:hypothetical protein
MIALSDTLNPNEGGFECVAGFHREFENYFNGPSQGAQSGRGVAPVCVGDFTPIQPREDRDVLLRFRHIPVIFPLTLSWSPLGSLFFSCMD